MNTPLERWWRARVALWGLAAAAALAAAGCGKSKFHGSSPILREPGSVKIDFAEATLSVLPPAEGPYVFGKAFSPSVVELAHAQGKSEPFRLIGLSEDGYPEPALDADGKPRPKPDPADVEWRRQAMKAYKMEELKKLFGSSQVYIIRMSGPAPRQPAKIYALVPDAAQTPGKPPTGEATLLNALAVRGGIANLELGPGAQQQPLFDTMLNCQLAGMIERKRQAGAPAAENLWTKFPMELPKGPYADKLAQMEKK